MHLTGMQTQPKFTRSLLGRVLRGGWMEGNLGSKLSLVESLQNPDRRQTLKKITIAAQLQAGNIILVKINGRDCYLEP